MRRLNRSSETVRCAAGRGRGFVIALFGLTALGVALTGTTCPQPPQNECAVNADCPSDNIFCNGPEVCVSGACQSQGNPCQAAQFCNETADRCDACSVASDCNDNNACTTDACTNGQCVNSPVVCPANQTCDPATGQCKAPLIVDAGSLNPARSSLGAFNSGAPGTPGNNALNGSVSQQGVDPGAISVAWSVDSKPAGSGAVSFSNPSETDTAYTISPPAKAGLYVFRLRATNQNTNETAFDTLTLELLDPPTVAVKPGFVPTRLHLVRGSAGRNVDFTFTAFSDGSLSIFDGTDDNDALDLVAAGSFTDSNGAPTDLTVAIPATGDRATLNPNAFLLTSQITDSVGAAPGDTDLDGLFSDNAAFLTDLTNTSEPNEQPLVLYTSVPFTEAATPATATVPALTALLTEVGEVSGVGVGPGQVAHSGIGAGVPGLTLVPGQQSFVGGVDFNRDGFDDYALLATTTTIDVFYGSPGVNTNYLAAGTGANWPDQPPANANRGERLSRGTTLIGIAAGDVNGDGNPDLVCLNTGVDSVLIILGQGSATITPFANSNQAAQARNYQVAVTTDLTNARVAIGDVASDAIADIVVGAPNYFPPGGQVADGGIFVIHGSATLPASGTKLEVVATAPTGRTITGTPGGVAEQRGRQVHIGDFDGVAPLDLLAGHGNLVISGIEVFPGGAVFPGAPTVVYNLAGATDMQGGSLGLANIDGAGGPDILVGAALANGGTGIFSVIPNGTPLNTAINSAATFDYVGGGAQRVGSSQAVLDYNGDGTLDVVIGASGGGGGFWDVKIGPITADFTVTGVLQRLNGPGVTGGDGVIFADVNADGKNDLILTDTGFPRAFALFGLN